MALRRAKLFLCNKSLVTKGVNCFKHWELLPQIYTERPVSLVLPPKCQELSEQKIDSQLKNSFQHYKPCKPMNMTLKNFQNSGLNKIRWLKKSPYLLAVTKNRLYIFRLYKMVRDKLYNLVQATVKIDIPVSSVCKQL